MKKYFYGFVLTTIFLTAPVFAYFGYFKDVSDGQWYTGAVEFLASRGIVAGYEDQMFKPGKNVNRAEVSIMIMNAMAELGHPDAVCLVKPYMTDIGRAQNPVSYRYKDVYWLGAIFTADDCGSDRMKELFGGATNPYLWGSSVTLRSAPSQELHQALKLVGYSCVTQGIIDDLDCTQWSLDKEVSVSKFLPLKPFVSEFLRDDCVNCG